MFRINSGFYYQLFFRWNHVLCELHWLMYAIELMQTRHKRSNVAQTIFAVINTISSKICYFCCFFFWYSFTTTCIIIKWCVKGWAANNLCHSRAQITATLSVLKWSPIEFGEKISLPRRRIYIARTMALGLDDRIKSWWLGYVYKYIKWNQIDSKLCKESRAREIDLIC